MCACVPVWGGLEGDVIEREKWICLASVTPAHSLTHSLTTPFTQVGDVIESAKVTGGLENLVAPQK